MSNTWINKKRSIDIIDLSPHKICRIFPQLFLPSKKTMQCFKCISKHNRCTPKTFSQHASIDINYYLT